MNFFGKKEKGDQIILSGIKPTGKTHPGNYFGAMKQLLHMNASYFMVADYHSLNFIQEKNMYVILSFT